MFTLERAQTSRRVGWLSMLGLILVPLLVAGGFLWATWNSSDRLDRVQAAIVNNDDGVTLNGQFVPLGRQLAGGLVKGEDGVDNFDWVLTDDADAKSGLAAGTYAAVVTIPEGLLQTGHVVLEGQDQPDRPGDHRRPDVADPRHRRRRGRRVHHRRRDQHA